MNTFKKNEKTLDFFPKNFWKGKYAPPHPTAEPHPTHTIKILRIFLSVGHLRDPKGEDHCYLTIFKGINEPKSVPFMYENNAQTLPKQL